MNRHRTDLLKRGNMEIKNYWEEGYQQGLQDGKTVEHTYELDEIMKEIHSTYSPEEAQRFIAGYQIGFGESTLEKINEIRKKVGLPLVK